MLKNVLTLGPSSNNHHSIKYLLGIADRFRINIAHMNKYDFVVLMDELQLIFRESGKTVPVVIDLQGSKMRIGDYSSVDKIPEKVTLINSHNTSDIKTIPVPHKILFNVLKPGEIISLNDAKILLHVDSVSKEKADATVLKNGPLSSGKGINRQKHPVPFIDFTEKDIQMIEISKKYDFVEYAFSFVYNGKEANKLKSLIKNQRIIAKIERAEAFDNLEEIDTSFNEIWLCRGDLGAQAGIYELGKLQNEFVSRMASLKSECFLAGQVLEHMTYHSTPTRSEIVHLYDTEKNGFNGIILSDETAIGKNLKAIAEFLDGYNKKSM